MEEILSNTTIQYGFAGFCLLLIGMIFWMSKAWRCDNKDTRRELVSLVEKNTEAFISHRESVNGLKENIKENTEVLRSINASNGRH